MNYTRDRINEAVSKAFEIKQHYGTLSDRIALDVHGVTPDLFGFLTDQDMQILSRVMKTGIIKAAEMQPPQSRETLGFLIMFKAMAEKAALKINEDLESEFARFWQRLFEKHGIELAKAEASKMWGDSFYMDEYTKTILNNAYIIALKKWEQK